MDQDKNYNLFLEFIFRYRESGFRGIDRSDPFIKKIEALTEKNDQFFIIADFIKIEILWSSKRSLHIMGVPPDQFNPYLPFEATHMQDKSKHAAGRTKVFEMVNRFFVAKRGEILLSGDLRIRNGEGVYNNILFQLYVFYCPVNNTVFLFELHTVINSFNEYKRGNHYYFGDNFSNFRYPDKELLKIGSMFSRREKEIIKLVEKGMTSKDIADRLYISIYTVNTHRTNILRKSGCLTFSELIHNVKESGLL